MKTKKFKTNVQSQERVTQAPETAAEDAPVLVRRSFLKLGITALSALAVMEIGASSLMFLRARSLEGKFGGKITAGAVGDFPAGSVTEFQDANFYLVRAQDGGFIALYRRCPHLGCSVDWVPEDGLFYCPCHASSFDVYGSFSKQPVTRALDTFEIEFDEAMVVVNTGRLQRRDSFSPEQLIRPPEKAL